MLNTIVEFTSLATLGFLDYLREQAVPKAPFYILKCIKIEALQRLMISKWRRRIVLSHMNNKIHEDLTILV